MESIAGTAMDTTVLTILGAAFGVMFATLTTLLVSSMRLQHRDSIQTRELTWELIEQSNSKNRELVEKATEKLAADVKEQFKEQTRVIERNHDKVVGTLGAVVANLSDARERLAHIEGRLGIGIPANADPESNGDNSEAA